MIVRVFEEADQNSIKYEVGKDFKKLKSGKTAELNGVVTKYLKMLRICDVSLNARQDPVDWMMACILPQECWKNQGIS